MIVNSCVYMHETGIDSFEKKLKSVVNKDNKIILVSDNQQYWKKALELSKVQKNIFMVFGISPRNADLFTENAEQELDSLLKNKRVVALGEIGLDYSQKNISKDVQKNVFRKQLLLAKENKLPIFTYCRDAFKDFDLILREVYGNKVSGAVHGTYLNKKQMKACVDLGLFVNISNSMLNMECGGIIYEVPQNKILISTDEPVFSSKGNNRKYVNLLLIEKIVKKIASYRKKVSASDMSRISAYNAVSLFKLPVKFDETFVYKIRNSLYINVTNKCSSNCDFCPRSTEPVVKGHLLKFKSDPSANKLIKEVEKAGSPRDFDEVVFCGYGEPMMRYDVVKTVARWLKKNGYKTRINTNGHLNMIAGRDAISEFDGLLDVISVSLNFHNENLYLKHCRPAFGKKTYAGIIDFIKKAKNVSPRVVASVVEGSVDVDVKKCEKIVKALGVEFRKRAYFK